MTKDGVAEAIGAKLRRMYEHVVREPVPHDMLDLIDRLRSVR